MTDQMTDADIAAALGTDRYIFIEIGPGTWGKGFTRDQAHVAAGRPKSFIVYAAADPWAYIDGTGDIWHRPRDGAAHAEYVEVARKAPAGR